MVEQTEEAIREVFTRECEQRGLTIVHWGHFGLGTETERGTIMGFHFGGEGTSNAMLDAAAATRIHFGLPSVANCAPRPITDTDRIEWFDADDSRLKDVFASCVQSTARIPLRDIIDHLMGIEEPDLYPPDDPT